MRYFTEAGAYVAERKAHIWIHAITKYRVSVVSVARMEKERVDIVTFDHEDGATEALHAAEFIKAHRVATEEETVAIFRDLFERRPLPREGAALDG